MRYIVKAGDTLSGIAQKYGVKVEALASTNGIKNKNMIFIGQELIIPTKTDVEMLKSCLDAIEKLPEFKALAKVLEG